RPTVMRGVEVPLRDGGQLGEEGILRFDRKRDAEEVRSLDLLLVLGMCGEGAVMIAHRGTIIRAPCSRSSSFSGGRSSIRAAIRRWKSTASWKAARSAAPRCLP